MRIQSQYTGRKVIDEHGLVLGVVTDVTYDAYTQRPEYLVVNPGPLRRSHYVPVHGAAEIDDGTIVVPWDKDWFKLAPAANGHAALRPRDRRELEAHYAR
jgi:sporulation protein YlmC with PRC-barrel domain